MRPFAAKLALLAFGLIALSANAQITFRAASSATTAGTTLSIPTPSGTAANDVMIAAIGFNKASSTITPPSGWTLVRRMNNNNATSNSLAVYRRIAVAGEPASHAWGVTGGAFLVGGIQSFSGVDTTNPIDNESGQSTGSSTNHDTPSIIPGSPHTMLVTAHTYASSQSWTPQFLLTEGFDQPSGPASSTGQSITGGYQPGVTATATGTKRSTAASSADRGNAHILALRRAPNNPPTISITSPASGAQFTHPATITFTVNASDSDGTIARVDYNMQGTFVEDVQYDSVSTPPFTLQWFAQPMIEIFPYQFTIIAMAVDNAGDPAFSQEITITINENVTPPAPQLHFVHVDHLNTPRLVANAAGTTVWRWDQQEPFGVNVPDENPSGLGTFDLPLRLPGQYFDKETNLHYNYFRDYDPGIGRYVQSDPIGLDGGINTYAYVQGNPIGLVDPDGLEVRLICRNLTFPANLGSRAAYGRQQKHCFVQVTCPAEGISAVLSLFGERGVMPPGQGMKAKNDRRDNPASSSNTDNHVITPADPSCLQCCKYEKEVLAKFEKFPSGWVTYEATGWNSNSFAEMLVTSPSCRARIPYDQIQNTPGFGIPR